MTAEGVGGSVGADLADPCGKPCTIAPMVGGKVYGRVANRCWHEGGLWHDFTNGQDAGADLAAIEARLAKATPGEWRATGRGIGLTGGSAFRIIRDDGISDNNADFIAHAPSDVASLLALVGQLQGQLDAGRALHQPSARYWVDGVRCVEDDKPWPCSTVRALAAAVLSDREGTQ